MAGSFNHIVDDDGTFTMDCIDNMGDAHEALEECFGLIYHLADGDSAKISRACKEIGIPDPWDGRYEGEEPKALMKLSKGAKP